jgi:hypothetical protein
VKFETLEGSSSSKITLGMKKFFEYLIHSDLMRDNKDGFLVCIGGGFASDDFLRGKLRGYGRGK